MFILKKHTLNIKRIYLKHFPAFEIRVTFPLLITFFVISLSASLTAPYLVGKNLIPKSAFYWSFIPLFFYASLSFLVIARSKKLSEFFHMSYPKLENKLVVRRHILTQTLLVFIIFVITFGFFDTFSWWLTGKEWAHDGLRLSRTCLILLIIFHILFFINWRFPSTLSRALFTATLLGTFLFIDSPENTIQGRSLFLQIIPIFLSGFTISSSAIFLTTLGTLLLLTLRSQTAGIGVNSIAYLGVVFSAMIFWINSNGWESSIKSIEDLNKSLERKVLQRTSELSKANNFKSQFLAQISHELQSPIIAFSLFLRKFQFIIEPDEYEAFNNETSRVLEMTKSISNVAKIELDLINNQIFLKNIDLNKELNKTINILKSIANDKNVKIIYESFHPKVIILGNPDFLSRIFHNLIGNAIKYSRTSDIIISYFVEKNNIRLQVQDSGIGIPKSELPYIFDRFTRASNVGEVSGTGLGLSMVKDMVEAMHGTIAIESTLGVGTTVTVTFPIAPPLG